MESWVRYSVTVYFGLLLAGTLVGGVDAINGVDTPYVRHAQAAEADRSSHLTQVTPPSCIVTAVPAPPRHHP